MKLFAIILTTFFIFSISSFTSAQFDLGKVIKKKVEKETKKGVEKAVEKGVEETEDAVTDESKEKDNEKSDTGEDIKNTNSENQTEANTSSGEQAEKLKIWSKYDFVPGEKIIFEDNLANEESGEFPSRWDLVSGTAQIASLGEDNVIQFVHKNTIVVPLMNKKDFLPDVFTIEFDVFFEELAVKRGEQYLIRLFEGKNLTAPDNKKNTVIDISWDRVRMGSFGGQTSDYITEKKSWQAKWKHISISFNERSLKLYMDHERMLNIPNPGFNPKTFSICGQFDDRFIKICAFKNIRVSEGGKKLYDRIAAEGKFVTRGILFEFNKADINAKSMGTINEIVKVMNEHPELKFSIEGHTDSDGEDSYNLKLSEERSLAVKNLLVDLGVEEARLENKGWGESKPLNANFTPEEKANNRRVEFIKI
jgi:OmpA-OmpF porin, OOP family